MVASAIEKQIFPKPCDDPARRSDIRIAHCADRNYRAIGKQNDDFTADLSDMHVRRAVLTWSGYTSTVNPSRRNTPGDMKMLTYG